MKRLKKILCEVLKIKEEQITDRLTPQDVKTWDSMNALILVSALERAFNVKFTLVEVIEVKCVGDIKKLLAKHGVELIQD